MIFLLRCPIIVTTWQFWEQFDRKQRFNKESMCYDRSYMTMVIGVHQLSSSQQGDCCGFVNQ